MEDACYICGRTRVDLDRMNEESRTRAYLQYFTNARAQIDEARRRIAFLQRIRDEEGDDPHLRINAHQVFGDPKAYQKLMPWVDSLMEIAHDSPLEKDASKSVGQLVSDLLSEAHARAAKLEETLDLLRPAFPPGGKTPLTLETVTVTVPVKWDTGDHAYVWHLSPLSGPDPLIHEPGSLQPRLPMTIHLCTICRMITRLP